MLSETIREYLRAAPFDPFVVQMNDRRRFEVPHTDFAALNPQGTEFVAFRENGTSVILSTHLIASVERLRPAAH